MPQGYTSYDKENGNYMPGSDSRHDSSLADGELPKTPEGIRTGEGDSRTGGPGTEASQDPVGSFPDQNYGVFTGPASHPHGDDVLQGGETG